MRRVERPLRVLFLILASVATGATGARAEDDRPASLARYFPRRDLVAYVEHDGIDAHAAAWNRTAAARLLNETAAGSMLSTVAIQLLDAALPAGATDRPSGRDVAEILTRLARSGFAFAINRKPGDPAARPSCIGLVLRGAGHGPTVPTIRRLLRLLGLPESAVTTLDRPGGRKLSLIGPADGPCVTWWVEGDDLACALIKASHADPMIAALDGREPNAVEHPGRRELAGKADGFEPVGFAFLDPAALPELPPEAVIFGLDAIKRVDFQWGYQGDSLVTVSRVIAPSPRSGVLALFDQPTFEARSLPPLPEGVGGFTVLSVDLRQVFDQLATLARLADPRSPDRLTQASEAFQAATGRRLREDFLGRVGPRLVLAEVPTQVRVTSAPIDGFARSLARVPRVSLLFELADRAKFLENVDAFAAWANARFPLPKDPRLAPDRPPPLLVRRLKNIEAGYEVALSPTYWPLPAGYRPSLVVGPAHAALGTSPDVARRALGPGGDLTGPIARAVAGTPSNLTILSVADAENSSIPEVLANLPSLIQWWGFTIQGVRISTPMPTPATNPTQPPSEPEPPIRFRLRLDPDEIPSPEEIRPFLFPATYSMSADARGFRIVSRESVPGLNPIGLAPMAISAALPVYQQWQEEVQKERLSAPLRQVGIAFADYAAKDGHYPPPAILDGQGKPLLSWRVAILPQLGQQALYDEFHKDEPWDSPHNRPLIERMPAAFTHPDFPAPAGTTFYRGLIGRGAFFDPDVTDGVFLASITDGTTNTLAVVESREAVTWTQPGTDLPADPVRPIDAPNSLRTRLGGHTPGKFLALLVDGSVRIVRDTMGPDVLEALISRAGGEVISPDSF